MFTLKVIYFNALQEKVNFLENICNSNLDLQLILSQNKYNS